MRRKILLLIVSVIALVSLVFTFSCPVYAQNDNLTVYYIDVWQGDSELLQIHDHNILIDAGDSQYGPTVVSFLKAHNVSQIDLLVATHPHADHIGGMQDVLSSLTVKEVLDSGIPYTTQTYENFLTAIDQKNITYEAAVRGQAMDVDPAIKIDVLSPPAQHFGDDPNNNSVVLRVTDNNVSFLFMGDAGLPAEQSLLAQSTYSLNCDILKVSHHGSRYSSCLDFIHAVSPQVGVIEVGAGNTYGHPTQQTLDCLQAAGCAVYRTDLDGTVAVTTDGDTYTVTTEKTTTITVTPSLGTQTPTALPGVPSPALPGLVALLVVGLVAYVMRKNS